jgi:hypothetical protein
MLGGEVGNLASSARLLRFCSRHRWRKWYPLARAGLLSNRVAGVWSGNWSARHITFCWLNYAWIDAPILCEEAFDVSNVHPYGAFPDSDRWQLTALDELVHARPRHPKVFGGFGDLHPLVTFFVQSQPLFIRWSTIAYKRIPQGVRLENLYKCAVRIIWRDRK